MDLFDYNKYYAVSSEFVLDTNCPFCIDSIDLRYIYSESKYWNILYSKYPYSQNRKHFLLSPKRHLYYMNDLSPEEFTDLQIAYKEVWKIFKNSPYFSFVRMSLKSRSVAHLHIHVIWWELNSKDLISILT